MLERDAIDYAALPDGHPPVILVVIDTEEEFDWGKPLSRDNTAVRSIADQHLAQEVFAAHGLVPTYVVDYPVASDPEAVGHLRAFQDAGRCEIGAHLHPWVNPPHEEAVTARNSYPGNLPPALERAKLQILTDTIAQNFGRRPTVYKAGRYGVGPATAGLLEEFGYTVDVSIVPHTEFKADGGPDFQKFDPRPYWFGRQRRLLEIPLSVGFAGYLAALGPAVYPALANPVGMALHLPGVAARLGLMERIRLSPEGADHGEHRRLVDSLLEQGTQVFALTYHSPSLAVGHTPYVGSAAELSAFLRTLDRTLGYLVGACGAQPVTASRLIELMARSVPASASLPVVAART